MHGIWMGVWPKQKPRYDHGYYTVCGVILGGPKKTEIKFMKNELYVVLYPRIG